MQELNTAAPSNGMPPLPPPSIPATSYSGFAPVSLPTTSFSRKEDESSSVTSCNSGSSPEKLKLVEEKIEPVN